PGLIRLCLMAATGQRKNLRSHTELRASLDHLADELHTAVVPQIRASTRVSRSRDGEQLHCHDF
ncbi:MAG: hypothetical protein M0Z96_07350, partial [Actinomycetota bacterium]|nr:hypothetical protein [Actinomycetota bacterium]